MMSCSSVTERGRTGPRSTPPAAAPDNSTTIVCAVWKDRPPAGGCVGNWIRVAIRKWCGVYFHGVADVFECGLVAVRNGGKCGGRKRGTGAGDSFPWWWDWRAAPKHERVGGTALSACPSPVWRSACCVLGGAERLPRFTLSRFAVFMRVFTIDYTAEGLTNGKDGT